jgi:hypothetical protein
MRSLNWATHNKSNFEDCRIVEMDWLSREVSKADKLHIYNLALSLRRAVVQSHDQSFASTHIILKH